MQDGAPAHKRLLTSLFFFKKKKCSYLKILPANSHNLKPIEHLWGAKKKF